jgi:tetratricopeptide (TPR) repeat protein
MIAQRPRRLVAPFVLALSLLGPLFLAPLTAKDALADQPGLKPIPTATTTAKPTTSATTAGLKSNAPPKPTGKLAEGLEALEKADYVNAEKLLKAATGKDVAKATIGLARVAYETGKLTDAEAQAKKAAGLAGTDVATKADAIGWQATALYAVGKLDDAKKLVEPLRDEMKAPRARSMLVQILVRQGLREDARLVADALEADSEGDDPVYQLPESLACVGRAAHVMRDIKYANSTFKEAFKLQKMHVETNVSWARLFLDYYDPGHAEESVRDVLKVAPDNPFAHLMKAEVKLAQSYDWDEAEKELDLALKIDPKLSRAYFVKGSMLLHDLDIKGADAMADKGLAIDPNELDLLSLKAAIRFLDDDLAGYAKGKAEVFKRNKQYSQFYIDVGEFAEWEHRYDDIVTMMTEATKVDPKDGKAWAELGFNLLRRGDEKEGLAALDTAYKYDKYNVRLVNMLRLFE